VKLEKLWVSEPGSEVSSHSPVACKRTDDILSPLDDDSVSFDLQGCPAAGALLNSQKGKVM
jgi:hypothetical protein